ncbi:MAG: type II toxin-antitoxin system PemK/MazF family toxin [Propionibacteriaceae bacterium]|jgi:mRNA interferase MazF|nr:type II toxin-antitoxin system PemK/MazF family toxin [Propionibacteriaceae bacterium]
MVTIALQGDYGKPRPAVVVQSNLMSDLPSVVICPVTSALREADFRPVLEPAGPNGLQTKSQVMTDKITAVKREKVGKRIGKVTRAEMVEIERCIAEVLGFGG